MTLTKTNVLVTGADQRARYRDRVAAGLCERCGRPRPPGLRMRCRRCEDRQQARNAEIRERWRKAGLCMQCAKPRGSDGTAYLCRRHQDLKNANDRKHQARRRRARKAVGSA